MCISLATGLALAGGAVGLSQALKKPPSVAQVDPAAEQKKADALATQNANAQLAEKSKSRRASSLLAGAAPDSGQAPVSGYTAGKPTLGA